MRRSAILGAVLALAASAPASPLPDLGQPKKRRRRGRRPGDMIDGRGDVRSAKRRFRADVMLYLASIGKPQSGRQLVRFRRALRREERARALSSSPRQGGR
jgi:hypothetical protein